MVDAVVEPLIEMEEFALACEHSKRNRELVVRALHNRQQRILLLLGQIKHTRQSQVLQLVVITCGRLWLDYALLLV